MSRSKIDYVQYRIERSSESFQDAKLLAENERWRSCINRLYYSSFHIINALLFLDDIFPKTHDGLKTKFFQNYIKTGLIDVELGKVYSRLIDWRQESDYAVFVEFEKTDVLPLLDSVAKFNQQILEIIESRI